jgi:hypothetical protein
MSIWWTLATAIAILVTLTILLFWEGRRSSPFSYPQPPIWTALPAVALFAYLMQPLWLTMAAKAFLLLAGLIAFGWFLLTFGSRRPATRL